MESTNITIEIRRDTARALLWMAAGFVIVALVFFVHKHDHDPWPAVEWASAAAAGYILAALAVTLRAAMSSRRRILLTGLVLTGLASMWSLTVSMRTKAAWSSDNLQEIRSVIGRGVLLSQVTSGEKIGLLDLYREYHTQRGPSRSTMRQVFLRRFPRAAVGANIYVPQWAGDSIKVFVERLDEDVVRLIGVEPIARGRDARFVSMSGTQGCVQLRYTLTPTEVSYVEQN